MTRLRSRSAALPDPLSLSDDDVVSLEKVVSKNLTPTLKSQIESVINTYREDAALQKNAAQVSGALQELKAFESVLRETLKAVKRLSEKRSDACVAAAELFDASVVLRRSTDPDIETVQEFSIRLASMADVAGAKHSDISKAYRNRRGVEPNEALDCLISGLVDIGQTIGLRAKAHYSQASGTRTGAFVEFVRTVASIAMGGKVPTGIDERCARVLKARRAKASGKPTAGSRSN